MRTNYRSSQKLYRVNFTDGTFDLVLHHTLVDARKTAQQNPKNRYRRVASVKRSV